MNLCKPAMRTRPDLLDARSPREIQVVQITDDPDIPYAHVYMEAQVFSPDSRRFILERNGNAHGPVHNDPEHAYVLCDLDHPAELVALTDERNAIGPSYDPAGQWIYYFVDQSRFGGGRVLLERLRPDGTGREVLLVAEGIVEGAFAPLNRLYPLSTLSSDGQRIATSAYVGEDDRQQPQWGIVVFDLATGDIRVVFRDTEIKNAHPQYCRSTDPEHSRLLLVQQNHGYRYDPQTGGEVSRNHDPLGPDIHVIRDDTGQRFVMPWGRKANPPTEKCQGHQCWRGSSCWAITSTQEALLNPDGSTEYRARLIESLPVLSDEHLGIDTPGGVRNDLSANVPQPQFHHFATDLAGRRLITDDWAEDTEFLWLASLGEPGQYPADFHFLCDTRTTRSKATQSHPFLSPDGTMGFFNSSESGRLQAYLIEGLDSLLPAK